MSDGIDFIEADFGETEAAGGAHHLNNKPAEHWDKWILKNTRSPIWPLFFLLMCSLAIFAFPIVIEMMLPKAPEQQAYEDQLAAQQQQQSAQSQSAPQESAQLPPRSPQQPAQSSQFGAPSAAPQPAYGQMDYQQPQTQPSQFQQPQLQQPQFQPPPHPSQQANYSTDAFYATPVYDSRFGRPAN